MTQSGQGEEPSARQAREGIVLPSDGGEPLLPGPAGGPVGPQAGRPAPASAPPGGQAWDRPWGPDRQQSPATGQGWPTQSGGQPWGSPDADGQPATQAWPVQGGPAQAPGALPPQAGPGPLPPEGAPAPAYGAPADGQAYGAQPSYPQYGQAPAPRPSAPLPPADQGATQYLPPVGAPADEGATQYIPPVGPGALPPERPAETHAESTQFLGRAPQYPPQPAAGQQYAPAAPGHQPVPAAPVPNPDAEATQYIAPVPGGPAAGPYGAVPGGDEGRQPPAEFDNLFRSAPGADAPASATQQLPRFDEPQPPHPADRSGYAPQGPGGDGGRRRGGYDDGGGRGGRGGRSGSRVPLFAAVGVAIAVVGVGAGAMMAGGGEEDKGGNRTVSATAPASESASASAPPSVDPVRQQAVELDKLLAESGTGRTTVINAVADVKSCDNLPQAAKDLREAAKQRTGLVTSLSKLSVDKLPQHTELTTALTKAWQASASADNHYAAWADQTAGKKGCQKGKARSTSQHQAGNKASGTASKEKATAAKLWNAIAKQYGLTERGPTQL
ncbi:hypothetical protein [Streptomyces lancefieldiae]|uniref:Uncharacterized protein n=1 Tax=Streptomyces lancefieldiae TaxID=3075520 RepID=A0ABU3AVP0_9ACTN|nr:hypothetical protein [Streptomyces sp. DSM 40712]MDT0614262.1 hypothetical protein [Streptomyces sp. DSM 40712]